MKKAIILIVVVMVLSSCTIKTASTDDSMSTRVAQILTQEYVEPSVTQMADTNATDEAKAAETEATPVVVLVSTSTPTVLLPEETEEPEVTEEVQETDVEETTEADLETPTEEPTEESEATEYPEEDPRNELGDPKATDPMETEETWNWQVGEQKYTSADFDDGYMEFTGKQPEAGWRLPMVPAVEDMYVEMTAKNGKCEGEDNYGIIFHIPVFEQPDQGYLFSISCDGAYRLTDWNGRAGPKGQGWRLVDWTYSDYINTGKGAVNRIGVMSYDNKFYLYANGYLLNDTSIKDNDQPYLKGHFGVFVAARETKGFTVYIDEMSYWDEAYEP